MLDSTVGCNAAQIPKYMVNRFRDALKRLVFGPVIFPQQCAIGLRDPQSEVSVWLHGLGPPRDVTYSNVVAAARPFTVGIGLENHCGVGAIGRARPSLKFYEQAGKNRLLGEINLKLMEGIPLGGEGQLYLFEAKTCRNYCLPRVRLRMHYLHISYEQWRSRRRSASSNIRMLACELHSLFVFYICPRPVVLVSVTDGNAANIFPMDLIGPVGAKHFSLALHSTSASVPLMERSRRIALGSVPLEQTSVAYELGKNHRKACVAWDHLPFATTPSVAFRLPVPQFSLRVREVQIETVRTLGSYKLFLAHTVEDQHWADGQQLHFIHGFYKAWRHRCGRA